MWRAFGVLFDTARGMSSSLVPSLRGTREEKGNISITSIACMHGHHLVLTSLSWLSLFLGHEHLIFLIPVNIRHAHKATINLTCIGLRGAYIFEAFFLQLQISMFALVFVYDIHETGFQDT